MSRIFDALKRAESSRPPSDSATAAVPPAAERRRVPRRRAHVPVFVYGHNPSQQPFHEEAYSSVVSELGGLLVMRALVRPGQTLLLTNKITQEERECRVAYVGEYDPTSVQVAVEFPILAPDFWRLTALPRSPSAAASAEEH